MHLRGGERTFIEMARCFPSASLAVLFQRDGTIPPEISERGLLTTFLQRFPFSVVPYRALAPLLPIAAASLDRRAFRVISSSSGWAHLVRPREGGTHLCYMHTPPRYLWWEEDLPVGGVGRAAAAAVLPWLRQIDQSGAQAVSSFAANSKFTADRIKTVYRRDSVVIYPPVDTSGLHLAEPGEKANFALTVAELVPYKRVDLAIAAADQAGIPLVVVGDGPERQRLRSSGSSRIKFLGRVNRAVLDELLRQARAFLHPAIEDFGIVMVEALASGTPVVAMGRGGAAEIVTEDCGVLAGEQTVSAMAQALSLAWGRQYDPVSLRRSAQRFSSEIFRERLTAWVAEQS
ncbi:MAG: glycosyltransferase [Chloroflexota bacterium]